MSGWHAYLSAWPGVVGTAAVDPTSETAAHAQYYVRDATCAGDVTIGTSGSVAVTAIDAAHVTGALDVMFDDGSHLTGTFDAPI